MNQTSQNETLRKTVFAAIFAAITYIVFAYLSIPVPTPGGMVSIHLGNAFVVLGALLLGGTYGGIGGALGLTIADLIVPAYLPEAPITFVIKLLVGLITGLVAHKIGHITTQSNPSKVRVFTIAAAASGLAFNALFDPVLRYFYKLLILGKPAAEVTFAINFGVTLLNSVVSLIIVIALYAAIRTPLKKAGLLFRI